MRITAVIMLLMASTVWAASPENPKKSDAPQYDLKVGKKIYKEYCALCHETGSGGAPRIKDKAKWSARIKKDNATLIAEATNGYKLMPPKGNCYQCTDGEIADAVAYIRTLVTPEAEKK